MIRWCVKGQIVHQRAVGPIQYKPNQETSTSSEDPAHIYHILYLEYNYNQRK